MKIKFGLQDTIARRFALTIVIAVAAAMSLNALFVQFAGVWGRPSLFEIGLLDRAEDIVRMIEATPPQARQAVADAVTNPAFHVDWYSQGSATTGMLEAAAALSRDMKLPGFQSGGHQRRMVHFDAFEPPPSAP